MIKRTVSLVAIAFAMMIFAAGNVSAAVTTFSHTDDNPNSPRYTESVGPYDGTNTGTVTMWYNQYNKY